MDRELMIIITVCSFIVLIPVVGYIVYLMIRSKRDYALVENLPVSVKSRLSSSEAITPLDDRTYREYREGVIRDDKGMLVFLTLIIVVETILMLFKYSDDMMSVIKGNVIVYLLIVAFWGAALGYKLFKLGDNVGIVKMQCEIIKLRIGSRERWALVAFYDRDKNEFRKIRIYNSFNRLYVKEGNYLLARHGADKMKIIGLYQEKITPDNSNRVENFKTGWNIKMK